MSKANPELKAFQRQMVVRLNKLGIKQSIIAEATGISQGRVSQILARYEREGESSLIPSKAKGAETKLNEEQFSLIPSLLACGAEAFGFQGDIWTLKRVSHIIEKRFEVHYSLKHVSRILARLNYSLQKPKLVDYRQNPEEVEKWRSQKIKEVKKNSGGK